jgi:hypothetical protein
MMEQMNVSGQEKDGQAEKQGCAGLAAVEDKRGTGQQDKGDDCRLLRQEMRAARADAEDEADRDRQEDVALAPAEGVSR